MTDVIADNVENGDNYLTELHSKNDQNIILVKNEDIRDYKHTLFVLFE